MIPAYPNLEVAELSYRLLAPSLSHLHDVSQAALLKAIKADHMGPYYRSLYDTPNITINLLSSPRLPPSPRLARAQLESGPLGRRDDELLTQLDAQCKKELDALEEKIQEAEKMEGESEIGEAWRAKAMYLTRIGEKACTNSRCTVISLPSNCRRRPLKPKRRLWRRPLVLDQRSTLL